MMSECDVEWQTVMPGDGSDSDPTVVWHHICSRAQGHLAGHLCLCGDEWPHEHAGISEEGRDWLRSILSQFHLVTDDTPDTSGDDDE